MQTLLPPAGWHVPGIIEGDADDSKVYSSSFLYQVSEIPCKTD